MPSPLRARSLVSIPLALALVAFGAQLLAGDEPTAIQASVEGPTKGHALLVNVPTVERAGEIERLLDLDSLSGHSGDLRVRIMTGAESDGYPIARRRFGFQFRTPGVRPWNPGNDSVGFAFVTMVPWERKLGSHLNSYHLGYWPAELRRAAAGYDNPEGFIEVTEENVATRLSTHFRLRDFLTHDQQKVWPKYVVVREELLDKLELVLDALESFGVVTEHVTVLSGFRSPQYNARGVGEGMAQSSRHQFGDAADIIIDANRDGRMDDLNNDGRLTFTDLHVLDQAVQLVEYRYPDLVGGLGLYHAMGPSGPFAHIDVRGTRARWTNGGRPRRAAPAGGGRAITARPTGTCTAEGEMAVLCAGMR
jgi:Peptidase M15